MRQPVALLRLAPAAAALAVLPAVAYAAAPPLATHVCPNGLEVVVVEKHAVPLVTVEIAAHNGAMTEPPEYNGLSHLYEHMFFKGNAVMPDQTAYMKRAMALGMQFDGTTSTERVNYFFTTTSDHAADAMVFMRDAVVTPLFDPKELARERVVVTEEIDRNESEPGYYIWHTTTQHAYAKYPSRKDPLGKRSTVLAATVEKMKTIQHRYYVPNNSLLVVVGDVKADDVFKQADRIYASWAKADDPFVKFPLVKHPPIAKSEVVLVPQPVENFDALVEWHGPQTSDASVAATYAADIVSVAADEPSSKFQRALVDSGLCVRAGLGYDTERNSGTIILQFEAVPDKVDACTSAVFAELPKLRAPDYFGDDELSNAAHRQAVHAAQARERTDGYAHLVTLTWANASLDYYLSYDDKAAAVTHDDVARYLDTWVLGRPFVFGAMASPALIKSGGVDLHKLEHDAAIGGAR